MDRLQTITARSTLAWSGADAIVSGTADRLLRMKGNDGGLCMIPWWRIPRLLIWRHTEIDSDFDCSEQPARRACNSSGATATRGANQ
jgi:hypothetical protein